MTEERLQRSVSQFLALMERKATFRYFAVPNGGHMSAAMGARRKKMGAKAGVPDIIIQAKGGRCIEVELKTPNGRLSKSQKARMKQSMEMDIPYYVCRSVDDVEGVLKKEGLL